MTFAENRQKFSGLSESIGRTCAKFGFSPNQWTLLTLIPTFAALWFLVQESFLFAAIFFIVASFIDMVDGAVARATNRVSTLGGYLDTIVDRYVEGIILLGLLFTSLPDLFLSLEVWVFLFLFGGMMTTYAKAAAKEKDLVTTETSGGLLERAERLLLLFLGMLLALHTPLFLTAMVALLAILANITALQRIVKFTSGAKK